MKYSILGLCAYAIVFCAGLIAFFYFSKKRRDEEISSKWEEEEEVLYKVDDKIVDDVPESAFVFVKYREMVFCMRVDEKKKMWDKMNRTQRNEQLEAMKKAVRQMKIRVEKLAEGVECYVPLAKSLAQAKDEYNKFIELGGKLQE